MVSVPSACKSKSGTKVFARAGVTLRNDAVRSSVGEMRPATSSVACCTPARRRSTVTPSRNERRAGASNCTVCPLYCACNALTTACLPVALSVAVELTRASAPPTLCKSDDSLSLSASCGPFNSSRALPVIPLVAMPSAASCNATIGCVVGSSTLPATVTWFT